MSSPPVSSPPMPLPNASSPNADEQLANQLRALGHPVRLNILRIIAEKQNHCCCGGVCEYLSLAQSTVSQHIKVLLDAGLIARRTKGTRNFYVVVEAEFERVSTAFAGLASGLLASRAPDQNISQ